MIRFSGKGVYGAIAIGTVSLFTHGDTKVKKWTIDNPQEEKERFEEAKSIAKQKINEIYNKALDEVGETNAQIFEIHMMMLDDDDYNESISEMIENEKINAEYAVFTTGENFAEMFSSMDDSYMKARAADVKDISAKLIACLMKEETEGISGVKKTVICADDLAPSETIALDKNKVLAFVTVQGSSHSHTAILARNMNIPAIVGVGDEFLEVVKENDTVIVDGYTGEVIIDPDDATLVEFKEKQKKDLAKKSLLQLLKGQESITLNGTKINIYANIGGIEDVNIAVENDAEGIGLFRSEFLYLESEEFPTEEQQFAVYKKVLEGMNGKKVIVRTLDIGADKQVDYFRLEKEDNPALGLRAIRICLTRPEIFKTQLRALYRASMYGTLGIMFPMIVSVSEVEEVLAICDEVKKELDDEGVAYSKNIEMGIMIETPAAAIISDKLAPLVDFFSIGTNDLTQYTLACDRQNLKLERFCDVHHEAILRLIEMVVKNAHQHNTWVGICGELGADTELTETFLRMGVDELSISPTYVLKLRNIIRNLKL